MRGKRFRGWACLVWLLALVVLVGCSGRRGGGGFGSSGGSSSSGSSGGADRPDLGNLPVPDIDVDLDDGEGGSSGGDSGGASGGDSGGSSGGGTEREPTDAREEAFREVAQGSCLPIYRDGEEWAASTPPDAVSCRSERAGLFQVTDILIESTSCPTGAGRDRWSYRSNVTGNTTTLCLNRVWVKHYCVLAEQSGDTITSIGRSTAVDCDATRVPVPYNQVLIVAAVYRASPGDDASNCRTGSRDNRRYWSLIVDDGDTLVCFTYPA